MSDLSYVRVEWDQEIATVTVNRPEKMNALNGEVIDEIGQAFASLSGDADVKGVILTGAGEKAFVAGADIAELVTMDAVTGVEVSRQGQEVFSLIERFPKPVVAAVGGFALGGGFELALACHMRLASENARFGLPEVGLGIIPGYGGTIRLARLIGLGRAVEMTLTGEMIRADRAQEIGLVSGVVPRDSLLEEAHRLIRKVTKNGPIAVEKALESVYHALDAATPSAMEFESSLFGLLASTADMKEGMTAFLEKRPAEFKGE